MLVRKGKGEKNVITFYQTSFCASFASVNIVNDPVECWRCVQVGLPEKKVWRARIRSIFDSPRGKGRREGQLGTRLELGSVKQGSRAKIMASFCNSHLVIQVERGGNVVLVSVCDVSPTSSPVCE